MVHVNRWVRYCALVMVVIGLVLPVRSARAAAILVVTTTADTVAVDGNCSLREAIQAANTKTTVNECTHDGSAGADTINLGVTGTISLTGVLSDLNTSLNIVGPGATSLTIRRDTGGDYRLLTILSGAQVSITGVTLANGHMPGYLNGGAINNAGILTVTAIVFDGNSTTESGGALENSGTLSVSQSTFVNNHADYYGGGIHVSSGAVTVTASTFTSNTSGFDGGALQLEGGKLLVLDSTLSKNTTPYSGGGAAGYITLINSTIVYNTAGPSSGGVDSNVTLGNSIVYSNSAHFNKDLSGFTSLGHNLIGNSYGVYGNVPSDLLGVNPLIGPLALNGNSAFGPLSYALLPGSPAINAGSNALCPALDQRGVARPQGGACDIGAVESLSWPRAFAPLALR